MAITERQRAARAEGLGASDIPTILGLNPWGNVHDLYLAKTGRLEPTPETTDIDAAEVGTHIESTIRTLAEKRLVAKLVKPTATFVAPNGIMRANVDFMVGKAQRGAPIVEAKSTGQLDEWDGGERLPDKVLVQVAAQFVCAGSDAAYVAAIFGRFGLTFRLFPLERDADMARLCAIVEETAVDWWRKHVETDTPPDVAPSIEAARMIRRETGKSCTIADELVEAWLRAKGEADEASYLESQAKANVLAAMGDAQIGVCGAGEVRVKSIDSRRIDSDKLRLSYPDAARECTKVSTSTRVTWHENKDASNG